MAPRRWNDADEQKLRDLHATGMSLHAIAAEMGYSKYTISSKAKQIGLPWNRAKTAAATEAKKIDNAARRALLEERYLTEADKLLNQLWEPCIVHSFGGKDNVYTEQEITKPPFSDQRNIVQASSIAATAANRLRDMSVDPEASAVDRWINTMIPDSPAALDGTPTT